MNSTNQDASVVYKTPSLTPSGFFGSGKDMIVELENFMTQEEMDFLEAAARKITIWDVTESHVNENGTTVYDANYWKDRVCTSPSLDKNDPEIRPILQGLFQRLQPIVEEFYKVKVTPTGTTIVRWLPGQFQNPHADKELHELPDIGMPNDFPYYDLSSLFYLNDDYEGGELYFDKFNLKIKPKAGDLYLFPSTYLFSHASLPVTEGTKYSIVTMLDYLEAPHTPDYREIEKRYTDGYA